VQVITKGGTNRFHGSGSWYHQNNHLATRNIFESRVPVVRRNLYGYSIGGPIIRNRTFFFNSFEGIRREAVRGGGARQWRVPPGRLQCVEPGEPGQSESGSQRRHIRAIDHGVDAARDAVGATVQFLT
jgi:hypothetical protein